LLSIAVIKTVIKATWGRSIYFAHMSQAQSITEGSWDGNSSKARAEAETLEEYWLLPCFSWLAQAVVVVVVVVFLNVIQNLLPGHGTTHHGLPTPINH